MVCTADIYLRYGVCCLCFELCVFAMNADLVACIDLFWSSLSSRVTISTFWFAATKSLFLPGSTYSSLYHSHHSELFFMNEVALILVSLELGHYGLFSVVTAPQKLVSAIKRVGGKMFCQMGKKPYRFLLLKILKICIVHTISMFCFNSYSVLLCNNDTTIVTWVAKREHLGEQTNPFLSLSNPFNTKIKMLCVCVCVFV